MGDLNILPEQPPANMLAGALAHLARHMESGCTRSAYLAAMLLKQVAADPEKEKAAAKIALEKQRELQINPDCPLAILGDFAASCEPSPRRQGEAGSNGYH